MPERVIRQTGRGFLLLDAHPVGCFESVAAMRPEPAEAPRRIALIIGSSAGYGLATTIAGLSRYGISGVGVAFERPPGRRTATAGWYRTIATDRLAAELGSDITFVNADAFADTTKDEVLDLLNCSRSTPGGDWWPRRSGCGRTAPARTPNRPAIRRCARPSRVTSGTAVACAPPATTCSSRTAPSMPST